MTTEKRVALVTGGNRGIGFEICRQLAQNEIEVVLGARDLVKAEDAANRLADKGASVIPRLLDVTSPESITGLVDQIEAEYRRLDILVNSMCPGWVKTDMGGPNAIREIEDSADTAIWLATLPDDGPTGGFFKDRKPLPW